MQEQKDGVALELSLNVLGSNGIDFKEGWQTGTMNKPGIAIDTVWCTENRVRYGGCIDRDDAIRLHRFLGKCIEKWNAEDMREDGAI